MATSVFEGVPVSFHKLSSHYTWLLKVESRFKPKYVQVKSPVIFTASLGQVDI